MEPLISSEESDIFRAAVAGVKRQGPVAHARHRPVAPKPRPRSREADERAVLEELRYGPVEPDPVDSVEALSYRAPGIQDKVWKRLQRGTYRLQAELDLHGMNRECARAEVAAFIGDCRDGGIRCVRIIHGKGLRSPNSGPVIRSLLDGWLRRREDVLAFCAARPHDGGTGAVYVLLKSLSQARNKHRS